MYTRFSGSTLKAMVLAALCLLTQTGQAQTLFLNPPRISPGNTEGPFTLDLMVDFGAGTAVGWGTSLTLQSGSSLEFVNFPGATTPFRSQNSFFDTDLSDYSQTGTGRMDLLFFNFTPGANLGDNGLVTLGQVRLRRTGPIDYNITTPNVLLAPLGIPPFGSAVMDENSNNLLVAVTSAIVTSNPPTPEPSALAFAFAGGVTLGGLIRRRLRGCSR